VAPSENLHRYSYVYAVELSISSVSFSIPSSNLFTYARVPFTVPKLRPNNPSHNAKMLLSPISFSLDHTGLVTGVRFGKNAGFVASVGMDRSLKYFGLEA